MCRHIACTGIWHEQTYIMCRHIALTDIWHVQTYNNDPITTGSRPPATCLQPVVLVCFLKVAGVCGQFGD